MTKTKRKIFTLFLSLVVVLFLILTGWIRHSPTHAQSTTDFNQLPDEAFAAGLIIDVYETPQDGYRYAVALRSQPEYIHILDRDFQQLAYFAPTQSPEVAAESSYGFLNLKWSPDGNWLMATVDLVMSSYVQIWNTNTSALVTTTRGIFNGVTAWSADSDQVAVSEEDRVLVIDATNGQISHEFLLPVYRQAFELAWDASGERLAARNGHGVVHIWSVDTEALVFEINTANSKLSFTEIAAQNMPQYALFAWDPSDEDRIALYDATSMDIEIWDVAHPQLVVSFPTHIENLRELRWAHLGLVLYDTFPRGELSSIQVWSPLDGSILQQVIFQQQNEYIVAFLNLDNSGAFEIVVGKAPLSRALSEVLAVQTISGKYSIQP